MELLALRRARPLKAHTLYKKDHHYVVQEGEVIIVDDFTGRLMQGRRWSDGLHQAVEAKEGVKIERENQTLATITLQNYFRMYEKLSGMTGTAETEAEEFGTTYGLDVIIVPTNRPMIRKDNSDVIYRTLPENGTRSPTKSNIFTKRSAGSSRHGFGRKLELVARRLKRNRRSAQRPEREISRTRSGNRRARPDAKGAVTIARIWRDAERTLFSAAIPEFLANDFLKKREINPDEATPEQFEEELVKAKQIVDEEHKAVVAAGGLQILATERHESRRIDNQLRGRAGRQGDPGATRFALSLEDDLMRIFAGDKVRSMMEWLGMEEGVAIESKTVSKQIERAQKAVEARNFETRKHVLKYDDVMNKQRATIYGLRRQLMMESEHREYLIGETGVARDLLADLTHQYLNPQVSPDLWDVDTYAAEIQSIYAVDPAVDASVDFHKLTADEIEDAIWKKAVEIYDEKGKTRRQRAASRLRALHNAQHH
jgi:preprotein translocase subunit SecA